MSGNFEVRWEAEDGYCGGSRPQRVDIGKSDIESDMTDDELERLLDDIVQDDFEQRVSYHIKNREEALGWMKGVRDGQAQHRSEE